MKCTLMQSTQVKVTLAVNVVTVSEQGAVLRTLPLVPLTALIMLIWNCRVMVSQFRYAAYLLKQDLLTTVSVISKVLAIGYHSLCFGLGVRYL